MKLHYDMPTIHFKPVERLTKQKKLSSSYACPTYYYPIRGGTLSAASPRHSPTLHIFVLQLAEWTHGLTAAAHFCQPHPPQSSLNKRPMRHRDEVAHRDSC